LPLFFEELLTELGQKLNSQPSSTMISTAATHGKEFLRLGYSLSHVVHAYGAMCQAVTDVAILKNSKITAKEFQVFNGCLDVAIASAVSEFQFQSAQASEELEIRHLGFLAHELRNALSSATVAHEMITAGLVGTGGSTAKVLEANLARMRNLIDRSLSEVRMRADADVFVEKFRVLDLLDQIVFTARADSNKKNQTLTISADAHIEVEADRQFVLSAIANLVQNAIKYSKREGQIELRASQVGGKVRIEVQDECGGIDLKKVGSLFEPFVQASADRSGLGLGLSIAQRAAHLNQGTLMVENLPPRGCIFVMEIPLKLVAVPSNKLSVPGQDSIQPNFKK
jgi:signal transduction histidine kinase